MKGKNHDYSKRTGYPLLKSALNENFWGMVEYNVQLYSCGIIIQNDNGEPEVSNYSKLDMVKLDIDAVR